MKLTTKITSVAIALVTVGGLLSGGSARAGQLDDAAIIAIYNQVNSIDIETALVGQLNAQSDDVRSLAAMVAHDHTGVRQAAGDLATKIGVTPTLPAARAAAAKSHYDVIAKLRAASGKDFDRTYLLHEVKFHTEAMAAVKDILLPAAKSEALKSHFESVLPHFQHHLSETTRVAKKLGVL